MPVRVGYSAQNLASVEAQAGHPVDTLIASSVATAGNPEYDAAARSGLKLLTGSRDWPHACRQRAVAVAGTHGKTSTSSMAAVMLEAARPMPSFAIGANVTGLGTNAALGAGQWFVAEADESDGSLLNYSPEVAVVTDVEGRITWTTTAAPRRWSRSSQTSPHASATAARWCSVLRTPDAAHLVTASHQALAARGVKVLSYGFSAEADLQVQAVPAGAGQRINLRHKGVEVAADLNVPGAHNALNAATAAAVGLCVGMSLDAAVRGVSAYAGSSRRFELRGQISGIRVYDDYAHHPTEVAAVLSAARSVAGTGRVHAVFQPHLFSRTQDFAAEFGAALKAADTASVLEIYPAREEPIAGVSAALLGHPVRSRAATVEHIGCAAQPGDTVLTIGAGDITQLAAEIVEDLQKRHTG